MATHTPGSPSTQTPGTQTPVTGASGTQAPDTTTPAARTGSGVEAEPTASDGLLERAERVIYLVAGAILVMASAGLLVLAVVEMVQKMLIAEFTAAFVLLLDRVLLALMLAEIIYTVRRISRTHHLEIEPFLIVGIVAAVRRMLVITAESVTHADLSDTTFLAALAELGLLAFIILVLALAIRLERTVPGTKP